MSDSKHAKKQRRSIQHGKTNNDPSLAAAPAQQQGKRHSGHGKRKAAAHSITFEAIEPRILLSADPLGMALPVATASYTASDWTDSTPLVALSQDLPPVPIPAASKPVDGSAAEDEPLLTALSAVPATQSQLSISNVEVTLDPDGRVKAGTNIVITVKNTSESTFYGLVYANLELSNNENGAGPSLDLLQTNDGVRIAGENFSNLILLQYAKVGNAVVKISDSVSRVTVESQQEIVFHYTPTSTQRINGLSRGSVHEIGIGRSDVISPGTAYLQTELLTGELSPEQSIKFSNVMTSPALNVSFADLEIVDFVVPDRIVFGEAAEFGVTVRNRGNITANFGDQPISARMLMYIQGTFNAQSNPGTSANFYQIVYPGTSSSIYYVDNSNESVANIAPGDSHTFMFRYVKFNLLKPYEFGLESIKKFQIELTFNSQQAQGNTSVDAIRMNNSDMTKTGHFPVTQVARADLQLEVGDFSVIGGGYQSGLIPQINFKIKNIGDAAVVNQLVYFNYSFLGYKGNFGTYPEIRISLLPGEEFTSSVEWSPQNRVGFGVNLNFDAIVPVTIGIVASGLLENTSNNILIKQVPFTAMIDFKTLAYGGKDDLWSRRDNLFAGETATVEWLVDNFNPGAAQIREDAFYWSKRRSYDASAISAIFYDASAILAANVTSTIPAGNSRTVTKASLVLPEAGSWSLVFRADSSNSIAEAWETNNDNYYYGFTIKPRPPRSDLTIGSVTAPSSAIPGNLLEVSWNSRNDGSTEVSRARTERVVLRKEGQQSITYDFTYDDLLQPGASVSRTQSILIPATLTGTWEVSVIVDPENAIMELVETNNEAPAPAQVNILAPDLVIGSVSAASTVIAGEDLQVSWDAFNNGVAEVSRARTERVVLRKEGQQSITYDFTYDDLLQPGASVRRAQSILIPATLAGTWEVSVIVDPQNAIVELVETNNEAAAPAQVNIVAGRNLVVSDVQGPSMAIAEQTVQVDWRVRNTGGGAATQGWNDRIYLSRDGALSIGDTLLKTVSNQSALAAGAEYAASALVQLPDNISENFRILVVTDADGVIAEAVKTDNVTASEQFLVTDTPPQLVASALITPPSMLSDVPTAISWTVTNSGSGPVGDVTWRDSIFISADAVFDSGDERVADFTYQGPLAKDAAVTRHENITLPQGLAGSFYFFVFTDSRNWIFEYGAEQDNRTFRRDGNNQIAPVDVFATNPPDLEVEALGLSTSTALSGQVISVEATIANIGATAPAQNAAWTDQFYLSSDQTLDAQDISLWGQRRESGLAVGVSYKVNRDVSLGDLGSGTYYVIAVTDQDRAILDFDRANNIRVSAPLAVQRLPADLQASNVQAPAFLVPDQPNEVTYVVSNTGAGLTTRNSWTDQLWISRDDVLGNTDDIRVGSFQHSASLAAGASRSVTTTITPPLTAEGVYRLFVVTNAWSVVPEYSGPGYGSDTNNVATGPLTTVLPSIDLVVSSFDAPATVRPGQVVSVAWQVKNQGDGPTNVGAWRDAFYLSTNGQIDSTAPLKTVQRQGVLEPGQSYSASVELEIPPDLPTGDYALIVMADWPEYPGGRVLEGAKESNNTFSRSLSLAGAPMRPDLRVSNFLSPQNGVSSLPVTLSWTVQNMGEAIANPGWYDRVYLSLDGALNLGTDILLGEVQREAPLNPGQTDQVSASFTLPLGLNGAYQVIVVVGAVGLPNETVKADNLISQTISLTPEPRPDLRVVSVTAPTSAAFNEATSIAYTVINEGYNIGAHTWARTWYDRVFLSTDAVLDIGDTQLATVRQHRVLVAGESYTAQVTAPLQGITPGTYYVIVAADAANALQETNETNNVLAAEPPLAATMPSLGYGATVTAQLPKSGAMLYYRLDVPAGEAFRVTLDGAGMDGAAALYTAFNRIPEPGNADHSGVVGYTLDQTIIVPKTVAGTYFIAVRGEALPQDTPFTLSVQKMDFAVTATSVEVLGNAGQATLRIQGALFDASTRFFLTGPDDVVVEGRVWQLDNAGEAVATFFLEDAPVGSYSLVALKGSQATTFAKSIQVKQDFAGTAVAGFQGPPAVWRRSSAGADLGYSNAGGTDLMAPLFILTDKRGGSIGSSVNEADARPMQILGASLQGNPILLEPGAAFTYQFFMKEANAATGIEIYAQAVTSTDERAIYAEDWLELEDTLRPGELSWEAWTTFWNRIRPQLGATWGEYVATVNGMMVAFTAADEPPVRDVRELFRRLYAINGNVTPDVRGTLVDSVSGQPIAGVEVSLQGINDAGQSFVAGTALSDASGAFVIPRVGWGQYRLLTDRPYDLNSDGEFYDPELQVSVLPGANVFIATPLRIEPEQDEAEPQGNASTPRFATDADGRLHGVWVDGTDIVYSSFDGTSWSPATVIVSPVAVKELYINFSPKLLDDTIPALLVTWISEGINSSNITIKQNLDEIFAIVGQLTNRQLANTNGVTWSKAFKVTSDSVRDSQVSVAILPDGDALLTFLKKDEGIQDDADVYFTRLDLFTVNLGTNQSVSPSSLHGGDLVPLLAQSLSPERADFIFRRGDYKIENHTPTSREVHDTTSLRFNKEWEWKFDDLMSKGRLPFLAQLPGEAKSNKQKFEIEFALRERSLFEETTKINQFFLLVKKQPGVDVWGRLTQKESQTLYHGNETLLDATFLSETKFGDQKLKVVFVTGGSIESRSPIWSREWEAGKTKLNVGLSVSYTHETALIHLLKLIGNGIKLTPAAPFGVGVVGVADGLLAARKLLKDNKWGTLDLGIGATFGAKGEWEFDEFAEFIPNFSPSKTKGSLSLAGVVFGQAKLGNQLEPIGTTPLSKDEEWFNSNVLKDALVAKVQGQLGVKVNIPFSEAAGFFKINGEFRVGWLSAKPSWNWGDPPFEFDLETGLEPQFPGYINIDQSRNIEDFLSVSSEVSSVSSIPPTTPDFDYLIKDTAAATGSNSVYVGQSLLGNVASDLYEDGSPTLTTLADGRILAVWSKSSASELGNRLYSATFDGVGWSAPTAISGTYGFSSKVTAVKGLDGRVSIIWTQADPSLLEDADRVTFEQVSNVLRSTKVFHSVFDGQGFSAPSQVSAMPGMAAGTMALLQSDGSILLSWTQTGLDDRLSLFHAVWDGANWSVPGLIASDIYVRTHQLQSIGGQSHAIWSGNLSVNDQEASKTFVQKLNDGTWSAPQIFTLPSVAVVSPTSGPLTPLTVSSTDELPEETPVLDVPPWPAVNIDDFYKVGKAQSLTGKNLLLNDQGTAEEKSEMRVEKVNGQGPGTFTVTSKGGRLATINVAANGTLNFTPGAAFQNLRRDEVDVVRFLYVINDVGSRWQGELLTEDLRTSLVEIKVFGRDLPPEPPELPPGPNGPPPTEFGPYNPPVIFGTDPNDIIGPVGHGPENWINASTPLGYKIRFENIADATAPAKKVVITQTLDTDLDARSLRFGDIGFGDVVLDVPEGASYISQRLDLRATRGVYVDVLATVDFTSRTARWIFTAIDPVTGDIPQDGSVGFLPPNRVAGEGEGFVDYRISVRNEAQNGARIDAVARIVFDNEAPLDTPSIFNTIDRASPTSAVALAGEVTGGGAISLTWAGTDGIIGSGIASYTILVAKDGGSFEVWLEDTATTAAIFNGEPGSSYAFYSLARDHAGLLEAAPATPDVSVIVPGNAQGAVAGTVFDDLNQNGSRESGESVLAGATVFLDADGDRLLDPGERSTTSGAAGGFNLAGVRSGAHELRVVGGNGMVLATRNLSIWSGRQLANLDIGAFTPGRIGGVVFDDIDGDGLQRPGEAALSGTVVFLDDNGNGLKDTNESAVTTGADGAFVFAGLSAGPRKLVLDAVNGRVPTGSSTRSITVTSGLDLRVNFGTVVPGKIEGILFEDANGDGVRNGTERGLSGWAVFLDGNGNGVRDAGEARITTGMTGSYSFTGLKPGSYTVSVSRPSGWVRTSDPSTTLGTVQVQSASASALGATAAGTGAAAFLTGLSALQSDPAFSGITGDGIGIVVVDSGIDADHPFFGQDVDGNGVADRVVAQYDFVDNDTNADDTFGHGTHIAGIIASQDAAFGGVAPKANIIALRVLNSTGSGSFSRLEAALQWTLTNAAKYNIRVVNLSMGDNKNWDISTSLYGIGDELAALASRDILVIAAVGNGFYTFNSDPGVSYPAADPNVIAVGAVWATEVNSFSAVGAIDFTTAPDRIAAMSQRHAGLVDVFAPGMQIVSAGIGGGTSVLSGTSQAAGFTSGVAALAQQIALDKLGRPLKVNEFIDLLSSTSRAILDGDDENDNVTNTSEAYPRLDVLKLAQAIAKLSPGSADVTVTSAAMPASMQVAAPSSISISPGSNILAPIGLFGSFSVGGSIFLDTNKNGFYDVGEAMLSGARLLLDMDGNGAFSSVDQMVVTTSGGSFSFSGLGPGPKKLGVQTNEDQIFWLSSLSSTSRVNINGLQLPFQLTEVTPPSGGDIGGSNERDASPGTPPVSDPGRVAGPGEASDGRGTLNIGGVSVSPTTTSSVGLESGALQGTVPISDLVRVAGPGEASDGRGTVNIGKVSTPALAPFGASRMANDDSRRHSTPIGTKAEAYQSQKAQQAEPQTSQSDQQGASATVPVTDPRLAVDAAVASLGKLLPAQEARRLLVGARSSPMILLDEAVFEPVPTPAITPERHTRGDWVSDFLTDAGKVMQGPGDELVVLAAGTAALKGGGKRKAFGREAHQGRSRDAT